MFADYLLRGVLVGLIFGVPAGAIGALTVRNTLEKGFRNGFCTGLGSSAADVLYAFVGVCGLNLVMRFLQRYETAIGLIGAALIIAYGLYILRRQPQTIQTDTGIAGGCMANFFSAFLIAILNPATVLSFLVAFSAMGIASGCTPAQGIALVSGVLLGTAAWWLVLSGVTAHFRTMLSPLTIKHIYRGMGVLMMLFGIVLLVRTVF